MVSESVDWLDSLHNYLLEHSVLLSDVAFCLDFVEGALRRLVNEVASSTGK